MWVWAMLRWWYGTGWLAELTRQAKQLDRVEDYFSFGQLLRTLFQPFKQIDAGSRRGGLGVQFRAWLDRSMSRVVGASARIILLCVGVLWWVVSALIGACWLFLWPFLPVAPLVGGVLMALRIGVSPL